MIEVGRHAPPFPPALTTSPAKELLFSVDTYFTETWDQVGDLCGDPVTFAWDHGVLVLKPDAFAGRRAHTILAWLDERGFEVAAARAVRFDRHAIRALWRYQWNMATPERKALFDTLLTASDSVLIVVRGAPERGWPVTVALTDGKGPAEVAARRPHHLRTRLGGGSPIFSYLHTADEPADVLRELGVHCHPAARADLIASLARREDNRGEAERLCDRLCREVPAHSLDAGTVGARLERLAGEAAAATETERAALRSLGQRVGSGQAVSVTAVREALERCGAELGRWDELAITASQIEATIPGVEPVLRTRARDWDAMSAPARLER